MLCNCDRSFCRTTWNIIRTGCSCSKVDSLSVCCCRFHFVPVVCSCSFKSIFAVIQIQLCTVKCCGCGCFYCDCLYFRCLWIFSYHRHLCHIFIKCWSICAAVISGCICIGFCSSHIQFYNFVVLCITDIQFQDSDIRTCMNRYSCLLQSFYLPWSNF